MNAYQSSKVKLKYAIMGGTFDPIHFGHLSAAEEVRVRLNCQKVIFIPSGKPPHKKEYEVSDSIHRYAMTLLAMSTNPNFEISDIEINRKGYTYTLDTIKQLREIYGKEVELLFITGADAVLEIETWYKVDELLKICSFAAVTRPGYDKTKLEQKLHELQSKYNGELHIVDVPGLSISSTDLRKRIMEGTSLRYLVPEAVEEYINNHGLYRK
ncbi:MAG: nicotinate (nicotinamide) nucleotide adenylyltransferase [Clostridia bacterium]|jgi:nicotinate-nucleotide adenylyltransferase|nr:nicotinate (nicotinamide) nucleotide adenylyltransferase [Clostridia bacterium]